MAAIKGPAVFLAQFLRDVPPFNTLENICKWFADLGYAGVQIPGWDRRVIDIDQAATSNTYCDELKGKLAGFGLSITEVAAYLAGQVLAIHPAYEQALPVFIRRPAGSRADGVGGGRSAQVHRGIRKLGLRNVPVLSGGFAWHMIYPWPQRPPGLIDEAFKELARRWRPLLDYARDRGCVLGFELHPGSDIHDGATFEMFLDHTDDHPAACINYDPSHFLLQQLDYCAFIELYGKRISGFHVKDAEFRPSGRVGVYGGYQPWNKRAGRFRSLGDGQVDFKRIFTLLTEARFDGWAVLEWECCVKSPEQGAREGAPFIRQHLIESTTVAFDDFAKSGGDAEANRAMLGLA